MAVANVMSISKKLKEIGLLDKEQKNGYFKAPKSATGKEFVIFLPEMYGKKDRPTFLKETLCNALKDFKPKYVTGSGAKSTAGHLTFQGSQIYIISKLISAKGGGGNKGIDFEKDLEKDLNNMKDEKSGMLYKDFAEYFTEGPLKGDMISKVDATGKENTPRPLAVDGAGNLYVSVRGGSRTEKIGGALADLIVHTKKGKKHNLSLKYGSTVTFFNSGVGKIFNETDFKAGNFSHPTAKALLEMFDIDPIRFRNVFMNYKAKDPLAVKSKAEKQIEKVKVNKNKLKSFIRTVIGYDYILVHKESNGKVHSYEITDAFLDKASTPSSDTVEIHYPVGGSAKRIDIKLETPVFSLNFNIRNKQGGILPSHIMCDYKIKH